MAVDTSSALSQHLGLILIIFMMFEAGQCPDRVPTEYCILCNQPGGDVNLSSKGLASIIAASQKRQDGKHTRLASLIVADGLKVHEGCRKSYTSSKNIQFTIKSKQTTDLQDLHPFRTLRALHGNFEYKTHCLICSEAINFQQVKKHPNRKSISTVEIIDNSDKCSTLQKTLLDICTKRSDTLALTVKSRIVCAGDIRAVEAKYHRQFLQMFMLRSNDSHDNERNLDSLNAHAFSKLCEWLITQAGSQFTMCDLQDKLSSFLPDGIEPYSMKHLKRRLDEYFGDSLMVTEIDGKRNVFTFVGKAASILHDAYKEDDSDDLHENIKQAKAFGKSLRTILSELKSSSEFYPSPEDIDIDHLEMQVPKVLLTFMESLLGKITSQSAAEKQRLLVVSLCHILMQATAPNPYQSPLLLATGLFIHQTTRSKVLLNVLSGLGTTVSYDQVLDFERCAVVSETVSDRHPGIDLTEEGGGFCQWIADNFDYNEDTISGHNSTHVMGMIACQTPASTEKITVRKQKRSAADILPAGDFSHILPYKAPITNLMSKIRFLPIEPIQVSNIREFMFQDLLWLLSNARSQVTPGWQGFMSDMTNGNFSHSGIVYHPMIPLNPQTNEAVHSTMVFVDRQRQKVGQCCALLTFDQPLYAKAYKIKTEHSDEFSHIKLRLGGFHQLMSFLGSGCKIMQSSGLEDLWSCVYARNSIPKMFEGKSYYKTMRACLLTSAALHILLFEPPLESDDINNVDSVSDEQDDSPECSVAISAPVADSILPDVENICKKLANHDQAFSDVNEEALNLFSIVQETKNKFQGSRTAKLWFQFMDFVSIVCNFVRAERTGNWLLHMKASQDMLPWFAAAGHNNYTKYCRLYLQDFVTPCLCLQQPLSDGFFTVRRNKNIFWSGTWSDMVIEQSLMRSGKTTGGLINITHKDSARTRWLLSAHVVAQYTEELRSLTNASTAIWADHHRELNPGRIQQDYNDMVKFLVYLRNHNPYYGVNTDLRNIATGLIADQRVNVDSAVSVGNQLHSDITNQVFGDVTLKRCSQVVTFEVMKKAVTLSNGEKIHMSSTELYQRLLAIAYTTGPPSSSVFSYELATVSPALFHDDGSMRKSQKSQLVKYIINMNSNVVTDSDIPQGCIVVDGCALLQQLKWPKIGTLQDVCASYTNAVMHKSSVGYQVTVVFDSYDVQTTKDQEQKRRKLMKTAMPDIAVKPTTSVPGDAGSFLANKRNKQQIINLISNHLQRNTNVIVQHAGDEGDADVVIVRNAIELSKANVVHVISDDTDIFVLLVHHANSANMYMQTRTHTLSVKEAQSNLGVQLCQVLPFLHAVSGCDTTSALYGFGKAKHMKYFSNTKRLLEKVKVFGEESVPLQVIGEVGEEYIAGLYSGGKTERQLDELRYRNITSTRYVSIERMPPTSRACYFHSLRVHLQVNTWKHLKTTLDKTDHGFKDTDGNITAVITDKAPAPPELLKEVRCSCKATTRLCTSCSCVKRGIPCSIHCKCESSCDNGLAISADNE